MKRLVYSSVLLSVLGAASLAAAESQADIANRENEEGKELMFAGKYTDASAKFRDAVARVPEPKYFYNLCLAMYQEGKFGEALTACNSADKANTEPGLKDTVVKLQTKIRDEAKAQGLDLQPVGGGGIPDQPPPNGGDPNNPPPNGGDPNNPPPGPNGGPGPVAYRPVVGRAPQQAIFKNQGPDNHYRWTLGVEGYAGGASFAGLDGEAFGHFSSGVRFKGDVLVNPRARIGAQGYISYTTISDNANDPASVQGRLDILDVGVAVYKDLCLKGVENLCLRPLAGASLAFMDPNQTVGEDGSQQFNYLAVGLRAELAAQYAFGLRQEYVIAAMFDLNVYTPALADPTDGSPTRMEVGLDAAGVVPYFGVGFTYRFNTPLGARALVTLR